MHILNNIIKHLGKDNYAIDPRISHRELYSVVIHRCLCLLRGLLYRWRLKHCDGVFFLGRHVSIQSPGRVRLGRTVTIEDNVTINALSIQGVSIGDNVTIKNGTIIECTGVLRSLGEGLKIGNNVGISQNCFLQVRGTVAIGSNVMFGPGVSIFSENHTFADLDTLLTEQPENRRGVIIEDNVWIGSGAKILDGVRVGTGSVVGAGSVVTRDVPSNSIAMGIPARAVRRRFSP